MNTTTAIQVAVEAVKPKPTKNDLLHAMAIALWEKREAEQTKAEKERKDLEQQVLKKLPAIVIKALRDPESKVRLTFAIWDEKNGQIQVSFDSRPYLSFEQVGSDLMARYCAARNAVKGSYQRDFWIREKVKELREVSQSTTEDRAYALLANPAIKAALLQEAQALTNKPTPADKANAITV